MVTSSRHAMRIKIADEYSIDNVYVVFGILISVMRVVTVAVGVVSFFLRAPLLHKGLLRCAINSIKRVNRLLSSYIFRQEISLIVNKC